MNSDIYDKVKELAFELVNASWREDTPAYWDYYQQLEKVCIENRTGKNEHPFQWETLGDFTNDSIQALKIYENARKIAHRQNLREYSASISLAMAEQYLKLGDKEMAFNTANQANNFAKTLDDLELRKEISEFLLNECL